jgi:hypothetical protein
MGGETLVCVLASFPWRSVHQKGRKKISLIIIHEFLHCDSLGVEKNDDAHVVWSAPMICPLLFLISSV